MNIFNSKGGSFLCVLLIGFALAISANFFSAFINPSTTKAVTVRAAPAATCSTDSNFLGFPYWYRGVADEDNGCVVRVPKDTTELGQFIWIIALNIVEIVLRVIAVTATGYILYGGFTYLTSNGSPDKAAKGLNLITNASIGLILAISSVAVINYSFSIIGGSKTSGGFFNNSVTDVLDAVVGIVYWVAGAVAVTMFILAGIRFISSSGNPDRIQKARKSMTNSAIGLIVIILAFSITSIVMGFFN